MSQSPERSALVPVLLTVAAVAWIVVVLLTSSWTYPPCAGISGLMVVAVPYMWIEWGRS
jgi:hypothetical protein